MNYYILMLIKNSEEKVLKRLIFNRPYKYTEACEKVSFLNEQSIGTNLSFTMKGFKFDLCSNQGIAKIARLKAEICHTSILRVILDLTED